MTNLVFEDAEYTPIPGRGKTKEPNPYADVIAAIAHQIDPRTDKPVAKRVTLTHGPTPEAREKAVNRAKRLMKEAGEELDTPATVWAPWAPATDKKGNDLDDTTVVTFWATKKVYKPRKVDDTATEVGTE